MLEVSAGGVVIHNGEFLLLKKFSNEWVLPKGRLENNETKELAAIREVQEESGIKAKIIKYLGFVKYDYQHNDGEKVKKTVHYFYMEPEDLNLLPQREEGFIEAIFLPISPGVTVFISSPITFTVPVKTPSKKCGIKPFINLVIVVFPEPDCPVSNINSPA